MVLLLATSKKYDNNINIMPCVEGDRADCQPEPSSTARSRRQWWLSRVDNLICHPQHKGMIVFITPKVYRSLTMFISVL